MDCPHCYYNDNYLTDGHIWERGEYEKAEKHGHFFVLQMLPDGPDITLSREDENDVFASLYGCPSCKKVFIAY